jgi:hypothetical protein
LEQGLLERAPEAHPRQPPGQEPDHGGEEDDHDAAGT